MTNDELEMLKQEAERLELEARRLRKRIAAETSRRPAANAAGQTSQHVSISPAGALEMRQAADNVSATPDRADCSDHGMILSRHGNDAPAAFFVRVRRRKLRGHHRLGLPAPLTTAASYDVVHAVRVDGKPRHVFVLGLGTIHNPDNPREVVLWWIGAVETLTSHWNKELGGWYEWPEDACVRALRMAVRKGVPLPRVEDLVNELDDEEPQPAVPRDTCLRWLIEFVRKERGDASLLPPQRPHSRALSVRALLCENARAHEAVARRRKQEARVDRANRKEPAR